MKINSEAAKSNKIAKRRKGTIKAKSEFFRSARYGLTLQEHRIVYYAILAGQQTGKPFEPVTLSVKEFIELFGVRGGNYYHEIRRISSTITKKIVEVFYQDDNGMHYMAAPWLIAVKYHAKTGTVDITPNPELKPFFEGKPFSSTEYYYLLKFTSQYAERLYELLKSMPYHKKTVVDFDLEDLATKLAVPPSYRKDYKDLRVRVLEPAVSDINEYTDLDVGIRVKRGLHNKVDTVFFSVTKKNVPKLADRVESGEFTPPLSEEEQIIAMREHIGIELAGQLALDVGDN